MSEAPNYEGEYPRAGAIIGPIWQKLWDAMEDGKWHSGPSMYKEFEHVSSARSVLANGAKYGVLEMRRRRMPKQRNEHCEYRRTDSEVKKDVS